MDYHDYEVYVMPDLEQEQKHFEEMYMLWSKLQARLKSASHPCKNFWPDDGLRR